MAHKEWQIAKDPKITADNKTHQISHYIALLQKINANNEQAKILKQTTMQLEVPNTVFNKVRKL